MVLSGRAHDVRRTSVLRGPERSADRGFAPRERLRVLKSLNYSGLLVLSVAVVVAKSERELHPKLVKVED